MAQRVLGAVAPVAGERAARQARRDGHLPEASEIAPRAGDAVGVGDLVAVADVGVHVADRERALRVGPPALADLRRLPQRDDDLGVPASSR